MEEVGKGRVEGSGRGVGVFVGGGGCRSGCGCMREVGWEWWRNETFESF